MKAVKPRKGRKPKKSGQANASDADENPLEISCLSKDQDQSPAHESIELVQDERSTLVGLSPTPTKIYETKNPQTFQNHQTDIQAQFTDQNQSEIVLKSTGNS